MNKSTWVEICEMFYYLSLWCFGLFLLFNENEFFDGTGFRFFGFIFTVLASAGLLQAVNVLIVKLEEYERKHYFKKK